MTTAVRISHTASRRTILGVSAIQGAAALALIFAPTELAGALGLVSSGSDAALTGIVMQLYGAALFGLAMTGWMVKDAVIGGVFGRSYVAGNAAHAWVGSLALLRPAFAATATAALQCVALAYGVLALIFAYLMFIASPHS
jgi:hypothetical protein